MATQQLAAHIGLLVGIRTAAGQSGISTEALAKEILKAIDAIGNSLQVISGAVIEQSTKYANAENFATAQEAKRGWP